MMYERIFTEIALDISDADIDRRTTPRIEHTGDTMAVSLIEVRAENFKRLVAVTIRPNPLGVTQIIGENEAGKTSALDAISAALGGGSYSPELPIRRGATSAQVICDLGEIVVKRKWTAKGSTLEVTNADGAKITGGAQGVLDKLWNKTAIDPKAFERLEDKKRAATLAMIAGVNLDEYRGRWQVAYDRRTAANRLASEAKVKAQGMAKLEAPAELVDVADLLKEFNLAQDHNQQIDATRREADRLANEAKGLEGSVESMNLKIRDLEEQLRDIRKLVAQRIEQITQIRDQMVAKDTAHRNAVRMDEAGIRERIANAGKVNEAVRHNQARALAKVEAERLEREADARDREVKAIELVHREQIEAVAFPVEGLTFTSDGVMIGGIPFDQCSAAQKLRTSVAIGIALQPTLKLILVRDGSLIAAKGMAMIAEMATAAGAQILVERVENGSDVGIRIVEGETAEPALALDAAKA